MIQFIVLVALAYLMGSVCSAIIVSKLFSLPDPREEGSQNPGATNVLRLAGKQYAAIVIIADMLKGTIPVVIGHMFNASEVTLGFTALAAVIGHIYPVFFGFKGGKGVATALGAFLGLNFLFGVSVAALWLLVAYFGGFSSLASIVALSAAPILGIVLVGNVDVFPPLFILTLLILYKHQNNISRLINKTEPKIKLKKNLLDEVMNSSDFVEETVVVVKEKSPAKKPKAATANKPKASAAKAKKPSAGKTTASEKKAAAPKKASTAKKSTAAKKPAKPKTTES